MEGGETLKRNILFFVSLMVAVFVFAGATLAEMTNQIRNRNQNQNQNRRYKQDLKCKLALNSEDVTLAGTVSEISPPQTFDGIKIFVGVEEIAVYGLGPVKYWEDQKVERPVVGDNVSLEVKKVYFTPATYKYILMSLTYTGPDSGISIQLRNVDTGCPLWRPM
jgi:hypothetical protein